MTDTWSLGSQALSGAATWHDVYLPDALWSRYARAAADAPNAAEVYIALAIAEQVPGALEAFEGLYFDMVDRVLRSVGATGAEIDLLEQVLRRRFFETCPGGKPLIVGYAGRGELAALLRVTALRAFLELRTRANQVAFGDRANLLPILDAFPEHARAIVRLSVLHGLGVDDIAERMRTDRAVVARKLRWAREVIAACELEELAGEVIDVLLEASLGGD